VPINRATLHDRYRRGAGAIDVVDELLAHLPAALGSGVLIHALAPETIRSAARALPPFDPVRFPLWGLPFAIKDNIDLAGVPTTAGCPAYAYTPAESATVVARLIAAGAIPIGKTNLDQFATGLVGVRTPYPVPPNAFDPTRVPGGSSSGSAVAVATGLVTFALGTDTAGSGRVPAALNNLVGLKPSVGLVPTRGVVPACRTLDCVSVFALDVADAAAVLDSAAGYDARDPYSRHVAADPRPIRRLAVPRNEDLHFFGDTAAATAWNDAVTALGRLDVAVSTLDLTPFLDVARLLYEGPWVAERRAAVGRFMDEKPGALHPVTRSILAGADKHTAVDTFNAIYRLAELRRHCEAAMAHVDALVVPTAPVFPTLADLAADPIGPNSRLGTYTNFVNLLDLAAIAVPGPFRPDGLPAGLTLVGRAGSDRTLAALAARFFAGTGGAAACGASNIPKARP
jgi:allophanate hydrolase